MTTSEPDSYYRRIAADTFRPTGHSQGAWRESEQHMGPAAGLLAYALQTAHPRPDLRLCRISFDILGVIIAADSTIEVEVVRPGRTIELLRARMVIEGRTAVLAHGWRLATADTAAVAGGSPEALPSPASWPAGTVARWSGGFIESLQLRLGPDSGPGRCRAWLRTPLTLIADEPVSDLVAFTTLVDTANGLAARQDPAGWTFPNLDLTLHYVRNPVLGADGWVGLDSTATWGPDGIGLTSSALHDRHGAVGRAEQILTLRPTRGAD